jgi:hypothetical protein
MGPSRKSKRPRTKGPSVEEPVNIGGSPTQSPGEVSSKNTDTIDSCCDASSSKDDAPTPLKDITKGEVSPSKQVSVLLSLIRWR